MRSSTFTHEASDGHPVFVYHWSPDEGVAPRGLVHIVHGMAEHAARYARFAEALTAAGFEVYAHDHRGHGRTARTDEELGFFAPSGGWARVVHDAEELLAREQREHPGLPLVLFGHSMGSFFTQNLMYQYKGPIAAVVLSGSNGKPDLLASAGRLVARLERARLGERGKSPVLRALGFDAFNKGFAPVRTRFDWLSRDPAEVDKYAADPRCGFDVTTSLWVDVLDGLAEIADPDKQARIRNDLPVYITSGNEDPVSNRTLGLGRLLAAYRRAGLWDVTSRFYPQARHELLNETNRDAVTADVLAWLDARVPRATRESPAHAGS